MNDEELLKKLYYEEHNYDSVNNLYIKAKLIHPSIKRSFVKDWLGKQQTAQMNDAPVNKKQYLPIYTDTPYSFQIDLTFFPRYKKQNDNNYVLFTAININTRYAYAYYSNNKNMKTILKMISDMEKKTIINSITVDKGSEFLNKEFIKFCEDNEISVFFVKGDGHKLGIINRFHRTLKDKLTKHFNATDSVRWVDVIDKIIDNYNNTVNRSIGHAPKQVNTFIENDIITRKKELTNDIKARIKVLEVGLYCRIKTKRELFDDKHTSKYSRELYIITKVNKNTAVIKNVDDGNELTVKQADIKIVAKPDKNIENVNINKARRESKQARILNKEGIDKNDSLDRTRAWKPTKKALEAFA